MVSFFGLKLGGDRKKAQKAKGKQQPPQKWDRVDQNTLGEGQFFGQQNFSRPQFPNSSSSSRPGTADSSTAPANTKRMSSWRAVFSNAGGTASMTDLAPPPRGLGGGVLRHNASEVNLRTNFGGGSTASLGLPAPLGGAGARPGTPSRPSTRKAEWVNPLDVHFGKEKDASGSPSGKPPRLDVSMAPKSPLKQFEFGVEARTEAEAEQEQADDAAPAIATDEVKPPEPYEVGLPSPQSDQDSERTPSPVKPASVPIVATSSASNPDTQRNAPGAPRSVDSATASEARTSEAAATLPSPVSPARKESWEAPVVRNVLAKRDTFTFHQPRRPSVAMQMHYDDEGREAAAAARRARNVEGFSGNFAAFDFGAISPPRPSVDGSRGKTSSETTAAGRASESTTDGTKTPSIAESRSESALWRSGSPVKGIPASASAPVAAMVHRAVSPLAVRQPSGAPLLEVTAARQPSAAPSLEVTAVRQPSGAPPLEAARRAGGPPPAAAGAHPGRGYGSGRMNSPPRGFKSRFGAENHSRAPPPRPLRPIQPFATIDRAERSPHSPYVPPVEESIQLRNQRSPYGPPPDAGNYTRDDDAEPPRRPGSRPPLSPFSRPPMEGDFPKTKGLPRGRRLEPPSGPLPATPSEANDQRGFNLPSWSGFDRSSPRRSAIPAPLSTGRSNSSLSPAWSSPASTAAPPRLPSPTFSFPSLAKSISSSSEQLARSLEMGHLDSDGSFYYDDGGDDRGPMGSPTLGGFPALDRTASADTNGGVSPNRVDARWAPPRPGPMTLPPSPAKEGVVRTPVEARFQGGFI